MNRRGFLAGILAAGISPAIVRAASLMPVKVMDSGIAVPTWLGVDLGTHDRYIMVTMEFTPGQLETRRFRLIEWDLMNRIYEPNPEIVSIGYSLNTP